MAGESTNNAIWSDVWVAKLDNGRHLQWNQTFRGSNGGEARSIIQTIDGDFAVAGYTTSKGEGKSDIYVNKLDNHGNLQWEQTFGGSDEDEARSIVQTTDDGFAVAGYTKSKGAGSYDIWLIKLDNDGNLQWEKTFGGNNEDKAFSIIQTTDEGFAVTGYTKSKGEGESDFWVIKLIIIEQPDNQAPTATFTVSPIKGKAPLTVTLDASHSTDLDGTIIQYDWTLNDQPFIPIEMAESLSYTFNDIGEYEISLTVTDNNGLTANAQETVIVTPDKLLNNTRLEFKGLKDFYKVGETVEMELIETVHRDKYTRVDLWMAIELPSGELLFRTNMPLKPWVPIQQQQPYKTSIENTETSHHIFDFELTEGIGGDYTLYAVYVEKGENPITNGFSHRSNLVRQKITLANRKD